MGRAASPEEWNESQADDPAITSREAARLLGVSITTAQLWMESGVLASWKTPGGHRRTRKSEVAGLLAQQVSKPEGMSEKSDSTVGWDQSYPVVANEAERANFVESTVQLRDPDQAFDRITWLASEMLEVPISLLTFLTGDKQLFRAKRGVEITETPRSWAFCNYSIAQEDVFTVADATKDARFRGNPLVLAAPYIRFYAGIRIMFNDMAFGSLCVIDTEPRILRAHEKQALIELGGLATDVLRLKMLEQGRTANTN